MAGCPLWVISGHVQCTSECRRIRSACCARTASGQERQDAAALQSSVINSRRFIASPEAQDKASYQVEFAMSALGQKQTLIAIIQSPHRRMRLSQRVLP